MLRVLKEFQLRFFFQNPESCPLFSIDSQALYVYNTTMIPITFHPLYMERVWGGRKLEEVYHRDLPSDAPYGESWEISDREHEQSIVKQGEFAGKSLHSLWKEQRETLFGVDLPASERFPLLIKILDARSDLSVQVHPPEKAAVSLKGDPKTEMWYIADCDKGAKLYVGVKDGVTKQSFTEAIQEGTVEEVIHAIEPDAGESIFIPSGRLHAIGSGFLIYEIQENSDTTYRVFDWNRKGLDGQPRQLHVEESLACIDFSDVEPTMDMPKQQSLTLCPQFSVDHYSLQEGADYLPNNRNRFAILIVVEGELLDTEGNHYQAGDFLLLPVGASPLSVKSDCKVLESTIPA